MADIDNRQDILDVRDIIARVEELEPELTDAHEGQGNDISFTDWLAEMSDDPHGTLQDAAIEFMAITALLEEFKSYGGDEQWRGDWYPVTLIRDSYFRDYAEELAEDFGMTNDAATWPNNCIDWERAARELRMDYTSGEFDGVTYWAH